MSSFDDPVARARSIALLRAGLARLAAQESEETVSGHGGTTSDHSLPVRAPAPVWDAFAEAG